MVSLKDLIAVVVMTLVVAASVDLISAKCKKGPSSDKILYQTNDTVTKPPNRRPPPRECYDLWCDPDNDPASGTINCYECTDRSGSRLRASVLEVQECKQMARCDCDGYFNMCHPGECSGTKKCENSGTDEVVSKPKYRHKL